MEFLRGLWDKFRGLSRRQQIVVVVLVGLVLGSIAVSASQVVAVVVLSLFTLALGAALLTLPIAGTGFLLQRLRGRSGRTLGLLTAGAIAVVLVSAVGMAATLGPATRTSDEERAERLQERAQEREQADRERTERAQANAERRAQEEEEAQQEAEREAERGAELEAQQEAEREAAREAELEAEREAQREAEREAELEAQREAEREAQLEPVTLSGAGPQATDLFDLEAGLAIVDMTHQGQSNFIVDLLDEQGQSVNLMGLVNEIGPFEGSMAAQTQAGRHLLDIQADGPWEIVIRQPRPSDAPERTSFSGSGQRATKFFRLSGGLHRFSMTHQGESNFIVDLLDENGAQVTMMGLANEIGPFEGSTAEVIPDDGIYLIQVQADGPWSIEIE